ncbi:MAG TPA: MFS transporter [Candidatus Dormibacteraeota bacterium]|nr:MFS transporter [Candidatus Dormibacteraeota bacterium]
MKYPAGIRDRVLLLAARGLRAFGFGFSAVLVGLHLERAGLSAVAIGLTLSIGLAAASLTGLASAAAAARIGRRRTLALTGGLMALTGLDLALGRSPILLVLSGVTGMLGAASVDYGPFSSVEQAVLAETATPPARNRAFARYSLTGGLFSAGGGISAGLVSSTSAYFLFYAALGVATAVLPLIMSAQVEGEPSRVVFGSFRPLAGLAALFALDSLGGGLVANAVIAYWLHVRFGVAAQSLGPVFAGVAILQSFSYEVSGRLADRFGLINTMVFTHLPSNLLLLLVPFSPTFGWAVAILFARFALSQMDVPARQAYVVSIVPPAERAGAVAMTGAVRGVAMSLGPVVSGAAIGLAAFGVPFFAGGGLKSVYDLGLYAGFRNRRAAHET